MRQPIRKVKLFFPKLRDQGQPPTVKNTIPIDEQINAFITQHHRCINDSVVDKISQRGSKIERKIVDVKYEFQYIINTQYEGEFERALLIYEEEA